MERLRPAPPTTVVVARARRDAGTVVVVDGSAVGDKASALASVAAAAQFPSSFGHNLDALFDSLTDLSWLGPGAVTLVWSQADRLWLLPPVERDAILAVMADAEVASGADRPLRVLLLDAPG